MTDLSSLLQQSSAHAWLFVPSAILLGALHGLEPGHSKTLMAAFIVAIRGTIGQAVLLGVSAAISHSLIIWQLAAAAIILGLAAWMYLRTRREIHEASHHHHHGHDHGHSHDHDHGHEHGH